MWSRLICVAAFGVAYGSAQALDFVFEYGNHTYVASSGDYTWNDAKSFCEGALYKGKMVSIETLEEMLAIQQNIAFRSKHHWTSLTDPLGGGNWIWNATGGGIEDFSYWGKDRPRNIDDLYCAFLQYIEDGKWSDTTCGQTMRVVCEIEN